MILSEIHKRILTSLVLLPILIFSIFSEKYFFNILLIIVFLVASYEWYHINKKNFGNFFIGVLIIFTSTISAYILKGNNFESNLFFLWLLSVGFFSDTGGYIFGKIIGGKKITRISPNKTIAGVIGSFIFSTFPILFIYFFNNHEFLNTENLFLSVKTFILSLLFSFICQTGDILISYFKRKNKLKDASNILPGHGGLLDRIDGLIFLLLFSQILALLKII